jgi:hypothetical protein
MEVSKNKVSQRNEYFGILKASKKRKVMTLEAVPAVPQQDFQNCF